MLNPQPRQNTDARYLPEFSGWLTNQAVTPKTIKNYVSDVRRFFAWLAERYPDMSLTSAPGNVADLYLEELALTGTSPNTVQRKRASLRRFGDFWQQTYSATTPVQLEPSRTISTVQTRNNPVAAWDMLLRRFGLALEADGCKDSTARNYVVDVGLFAEVHQNLPPYEIFTKTRIDSYLRNLRFEGLTRNTVSRKSASLRRFAAWALEEELIETNPFAGRIETVKQAVTERFAPLALFDRPTEKTEPAPEEKPQVPPGAPLARLYQSYSAHRISSYIHLAILVIFSVAIGLLAYQQFGPQANDPFAYPSDLTRPGRILSFQGRVTDTSGTPISTAINMEFRLYNDEIAGIQMWDSTTCSIDPDQDGVFSTLLGDTCGAEIDQNVFSENSEIWLEVQVGSETLSPRQRIASVAYALNAETLQGFPASLDGEINTIPVINALGEVILGANNPSLIASSGAFLIQAESMVFQTEAGSAGDITFAPDAGGTVNILSGTTSQDSLYVANANLTSGNLIHGYVGNDSGTGNLLYLGGGSSETTRFQVSKMGDLFVGRAATVSGNLRAANGLFEVNTSGEVVRIDGVSHTVDDDSGNLRFTSAGSTVIINDNASVLGILTLPNSNILTGVTNFTQFSQGISVGGATTYNIDSSGNAALNAITAAGTFTANGGLITRSGGNLELTTTTSGDISVSSTGELYFSDTRTGNIPLSVTDTAIDGSLPQGIVDAINATYNFAQNNTGLWSSSNGALYPVNLTLDALIGGTASSSAAIRLGADGGAVFNEQGNDVDFRVESDTRANALFVDGATGRVGIGTDTPVAHFQIQGAGSDLFKIYDSASNERVSINNGGNMLFQNSGTSYGQQFKFQSTISPALLTVVSNALSNAEIGLQNAAYSGAYRLTTSGNLETRVSGAIDFYSAGIARYTARISSAGLFVGSNASPVSASALIHGISTTQQLRLGYDTSNYWSGTVGSTGGLTLQGVGTGGSLTLQPTAGQNANIALSGTGDFTVNTDQLYVDTSTGNVGIGDTSPASLFTVGAGDLFQVDSSGNIVSLGGAAHSIANSSNDLVLTAVNDLMFNDVRTGSIPLTVTANAIDAELTQGIIDAINDTYDYAKNNSGLWTINNGAIFTKNSTIDALIGGTASSSAAIRLGADGGAVFNEQGNDVDFRIESDTDANTLFADGSTGYIGLGTNSPTARLDIAGNASSSGTLSFRGTTDPKIDILNGESLGIRTSVGGNAGLTERLTILNNGNVGIGTTTPGAKLAVHEGRVYLTDSTVTHNATASLASNAYGAFQIANTAGAGRGGLMITGANDTQSDSLVLRGIAPLSNMNNALSPLSLVGGYDSGSGLTAIPNDRTLLNLKNNTTQVMVVLGSGAVGIGSSGPDAKLDVLATSGEQLRLTYADGSVYSGFTVNSSGNLTIDSTGTFTAIADDLQVNGGDIGIAADTDLLQLASGSFTINGTTQANGNITTTGTITLPNSNTLTGVSGYTQFSNGISVGGGTSFYINSSGNAVVNDLSIQGNTTIGNAGSDTVTVNSNAWTFASDTNFVLSGGVNGLSFDTNTLSIDASNDRVGVGTTSPSALFSVGSTSQFQVDSSGRIVALDGVAHTIDDNSGDLTLTSNSSTVSIADSLAVSGNILANGGLVTRAGGNLGLTTTTSGDITISSAGELYFSDTRTGNIPFSVTDTALNGSLPQGIVDAINFAYVTALSGSGIWDILDGSYIQKNTTADLLLGGNSTASAKFAFTNFSSGTPTAIFNGDLNVTGNTTLGNAGSDTLTINSTAVSIPNNLNFDSNTLFIDAANNRVGIGDSTPLAAFTVGSGDAFQINASGEIVQIDGAAHTLTNSAGILSINASGAAVEIVDDLLVNGGDIGITGDTDLLQLASGAFTINGTTQANGNITTTGTLTLPNSSTLVGDTTYLRSTRGLAFGANETYNINSSGNANLNAITAAGAITANGGLITRDSANLTMSTTTSGNITIDSAGEIFFNDTRTGNIALSVVDTALNSGLPQGIVDAINENYSLVLNADDWIDNNGALYNRLQDADVLIGGNSTASAKFGFLNVLTGTPTASVSAGTSGATYITANGTLGTTAKQSLILGSATTGNVQLAPGGSTALTALMNGNVGVGDVTPAALFTVGANDAFQINTSGNIANIGGIAHSIANTSGNLTLTSNGLMYFDDINLLSAVKLSNTATALTAAGGGIIDAINLSYASATLWTRDALNATLYPTTLTDDLLFGGSTEATAKFRIEQSTGNLYLGLDQHLIEASTILDGYSVTRNVLKVTPNGDYFQVGADLIVSGGDIYGPYTSQLGVSPSISLLDQSNVTVHGRLGIGTTNPQAKLDIAGSSSTITATAGDLTLNAYSNKISFSGDSLTNFNQASGSAGTSTRPTYSFSTEPDSGMFLSDVNTLAFSTNGTSRFTLSLDGIVPSANNLYDLGSDTNRIRDLYLGPASLHMGSSGDEGIISFDTTLDQFVFNRGITIDAGMLLDLSNIAHDTATIQGFKLPQGGALTNMTGAGAGYLAWDTTDQKVKAFNGTSWVEVGPSIYSDTGTIADGDYIEVIHNQNTNDLIISGWYYDTGSSSWKLIDNNGDGVVTGDGTDGALSPSGTFNLNTSTSGGRSYADGIAYRVVAPADGATAVTRYSGSVTLSNGIAAGDEVLLINLQGTSGDNADSGNYEFMRVASVSSTTITFTEAISKSFNGSSASNQKVLVQRVPNYSSVTLNSTDTMTATAWDGLTTTPSGAAGYYTGIVAFRASGSVSITSSASIDVNSKGYRGGTGGAATAAGGSAGESYDGTNGVGGTGSSGGETNGGGRSANGATSSPNNGAIRGGGGGGGSGGTSGNGDDGAGGGGGGGHAGGGGGGGGGNDSNSNGGAGGAGGTTGTAGGGGGGARAAGGAAGSAGSSSSGTGGQVGDGTTSGSGGGGNNSGSGGGGGGGGGGLYGSPTLNRIYPGSGGAGGGGYTNTNTGASGAAGGGIVFIGADSLSITTGSISSNGGSGSSGVGGGGSGGGGAGGSIFIAANSATVANTSASGGSAIGAATRRGGAGGGGEGRIYIESPELSSGATTPTANTTNQFTSSFLSSIGGYETVQVSTNAVRLYNYTGASQQVRLSVTAGGASGGGGSSLWTANGDDIYFSGGNVAIGQTTPTAFLDLAGATTAQASLRLRTGSQPTSGNAGDLYSDGTNLYFYNGSGWDDLTAGAGSSPWTDAGAYVYLGGGEVLGNSASAGSNKLAGAYFGSSAPLTFGANNDMSFSYASNVLSATLGNNDINFDSNTLFIDGSADRVGIGDITPAAMFTVGNGDLFQVNSSGIIAALDGVAHTIDDNSGNLRLTSNSGTTEVAGDLSVTGDVLATVNGGPANFIANYVGGATLSLSAGASGSNFRFDDQFNFQIQAQTAANILAGTGGGATTVLSITPTGDATLLGSLTSGDLLPATDDTYNLGSSTARWQDLFLGPASLHIGVDGNDSIISYDTSANLMQFNASGDGTPEMTLSDSGDLTVVGEVSASAFTGDGSGLTNISASSLGFSGITSGTNTSAAMVVGSGSSLSVTGTGSISATDLTCTGCVANSELANSGITFAGDTGSSSTVLGGTRTISGGTNLTSVESAGTITVNLDSAVTGLTQLTIDNLRLDGNTLDTTSGNLTLDSTGGTIALNDNVTTTGTITLPNTNTITGVASYTQFSSGISVGGGTTYNINSSGTGSLNALTLAGTLAVNGDSITADGATLTINAAGAIDLQDAVTVDSLTIDNSGAGITFTSTGNHDIAASSGTLRFGAATLTGTITGNSQSITGLGQLTVDNLRLDGSTLDTTSGNLTLDSTGGTVAVNDALTVSGTITANGGSITRSGGNLALSTTTSGNIVLTSAGNVTLTGMNSCTALETDSSGNIVCGTDDTGGGGGTLTVEEGDSSIVAAATNLDFLANDFTVGAVGNEANVSIDYTNSGITRKAQAETITGGWIFGTAATTFSSAADFNGDVSIADTSIAFDGASTAFAVTGALTINANGTVDIQDTVTVDALTIDGTGAGMTFSGSGNHDITASSGTLRFGAATLTGAITGNSQAITGLSQLTVDNLRLDGSTIDTTTGNLTLDSSGGTVAINDNITTTGTFTLPNTNTLTGVASYAQFSQGISVGGGTTYNLTNTGNANLNVITAANTINANGGTITRAGGNLTLSTTTSGNLTLTAAGSLVLSNFSTNNGLLYTNGSGTVAQTGAGTTGQCLLGNTGSAPTWGSCGGGGSSVWSDLTAPSANLSLNMGTYSSTFNSSMTSGTAFTWTANSLTSGKGMLISSTSTGLTTGNLMELDWSPGSATTATGDLFSLNVGANGTVGSLFNLKNNGTSVFKVGQTQITAGIPTAFTAAGDVSVAYDLVMTNQTANTIKSYGPLTIASGETFENNNLTLTAYGTGKIDLNGVGGLTADISGTGTAFALCKSSQTGTTDQQIVDCTSSPTADYAEMYPVANGITYGDVVALGSNNVVTQDGQTIKQLVKTTSSYQANTIGIVSDNYGDFTSAGYNVNAEDNPMPIALVGRVPVKMSQLSAPIAAGDTLTTSNEAGKATKATKAGTIIGRALESWSPGKETVMVFVGTSWHDPDVFLADNGELSIGGNSTAGYTVSNNGQLVSKIGTFAQAYVGELQAGRIQAKDIVLDGVNLKTTLAALNSRLTLSENSLTSLSLQSASTSSQLAALNTSFSTGLLGVGVSTPATDSGRLIDTSSGAYLSSGGVWTNVSDVNLKENFMELDPEEILTKINNLPITRWNYISEDDVVTHIGPTAQDFYSAFQTGNDPTRISTIDPAGVALAGIQGLSARLDVITAELRALRQAVNTGLVNTQDLIADRLQTNSLSVELDSQFNGTGVQVTNENGDTVFEISKNGETQVRDLIAQDMEARFLEANQIVAQDITTNEIIADSAAIDSLDSTSLSARQAAIEQLQATSASIAGTLRAENIEGNIASSSITDLEERVRSIITRERSENIDSETETLITEQFEAETNLGQIVSEQTAQIATGSSTLAQGADVELGAVSALTLNLDSVLNIGQNFMISQNMMAFNVDATCQEDECQTFFFQPSGEGRLSFLADAMVLSRDGGLVINTDVFVAGRLTAQGGVETNLIAALPGEDIEINLASAPSEEEILAEAGFGPEILGTSSSDLIIRGNDNQEVAAFTASGSARFNKLIIASEEAVADLDATDTSITTNATTGTATIGAGSTEFLIRNSNITDNSLIYVTPTSSTRNQVVFVKAKLSDYAGTENNEAGFIVSIDRPILENISFNWWIIN